jgi:diadenosine tetraphosphate (Ap4A) HIT family hydrolase
MATIFTRIINGELPGHFVWRDERCVAFLSINPLAVGHVLVVPVDEVNHWIDLEPDLLAHLSQVARTIGKVLDELYNPLKVALMIVGEEVPHVHLHVVPFTSVGQLDFGTADPDPDHAVLAANAAEITEALAAGGHSPG